MQWRRMAPVGVVVGAVILAACLGSASGSSGDGQTVATLPVDTTAAPRPCRSPCRTEAPTTVATTAAPTTAAPPAKVALARNLAQGVVGDDVKRMQQRLVDMGFDPGVPDGVYGPATAQAVWAYQKLVTGATGKAVNGVITAQLWDRMQDPLGIGPRRPNATSTHMEIYLPEQVAILFQDNVPRLITHISSGSGKEWAGERKDGTKVLGTSITPGGTYKFNRRQSGWWEGDLGRMHNPVYFNYGIAVHGMTAVPNYPASHGCVRIPMHISEYFPSLVHNGDQVFVWDGVKEPEKYGAQPPPFDRLDPTATTTTVPPTTVPPTTAPPPPRRPPRRPRRRRRPPPRPRRRRPTAPPDTTPAPPSSTG